MVGARALKAPDYAKLLTRIGAVDVRPDPHQWFTWTSGKRAPIYCDNRLLLAHPEERAQVADGLAGSVREHFPDAEVIVGTATAGIPHAAWVAERLGLPMAYVRASASEHGQRRRVEGRRLRGEAAVILEDLISYGGSALEAAKVVQEEGGRVVGVQAIFTYGFAQAEASFREAGIPWQALTSYAALVETLELDRQTARVLLDWRER